MGSFVEQPVEPFAQALAPYIRDPHTLVVVSSDFCHWGTRFRYTRYKEVNHRLASLTPYSPPETYRDLPIHAAITAIDAAGMAALSIRARSTNQNAAQARAAFEAYMRHTQNTICGRNPLTLLHAILNVLEATGERYEWAFTRYAVRQPLLNSHSKVVHVWSRPTAACRTQQPMCGHCRQGEHKVSTRPLGLLVQPRRTRCSALRFNSRNTFIHHFNGLVT